MIKKTLFTLSLLLLSIPLLFANNALNAIGSFIEFLVIQASIFIVGLVLILIFRKNKNGFMAALVSIFTIGILGHVISNLPSDSYDFFDGWLLYWSPLLLICTIQIIMVIRYFIKRKSS
ncbi:MAG: hypothetical protein COA58_11095 [Bacteroidetes bacterium]|nr:MAG: hypothetical protein COA58_11095 [Bacteroidota bacterium]